MASTSRRAKSSSSIKCCVPTLVDLRRPERIQRRTVSGSRLARRAASGTVSIVVTYYNNSIPAGTLRCGFRASDIISFLNVGRDIYHSIVMGEDPRQVPRVEPA